jgi:hypothetical protein
MHALPFGRPGRFYRGNLHTHSTNSDGSHEVGVVCAAYREAGYDFLTLSDHFRDDPSQAWAARSVTDTRPYRTKDFTTILGAEMHAPRTELGELWHIKAVGLPADFPTGHRDETGPELARRAHAAGAFIGLVHPAWYGLTKADADSIDCAHAIEVYNHGNAVTLDRGQACPFLDALVNDGRRLSGYASDDAHELTHDFKGGWVMVRAEALEPEALLASLKAGFYYASTGAVIEDIATDGDEVEIRCAPVRAIAVMGRGSKSENATGDGLTRATFRIRRFRGSWFRVTVIDREGRRAWSNPIWLD